MKQIKIFKAGEMATKPYYPTDFTQNEPFLSNIELLESFHGKSSKKAIRELAQRHGIGYDEDGIGFAKKIIRILLNEMRDGK